MAKLDIPVGPFRLSRLIGIGGTGEVWEGRHLGQDVPVAVKVITASLARDPRYCQAFANEVRAVTGLAHPGIVMVFDTGLVDEAAERASDGRLVAGSPYLAMEFAQRGSLRSQPTPVRWSELREQLLWLLEVLGHAHARGVIHRDLKPANVLVFEEPDAHDDEVGATRLRLTDFGLAHASHRAERAIKGTSGTPVYMAPEQFRGQWRAFGPWTDLYALGCMAWSLASGRAPFLGRGVSALMQAHLLQAPPPLVPRFRVPEGFEGWLHRLVHKEPEHRFQRAADAAWALRALGDPPAGELQTPEPLTMRSHHPTRAAHTMIHTLPGGPPSADDALGEPAMRPPAVQLCDRRIPPVPPTWRLERRERPSMRLVGAGLGLYGLREIPLVGREVERDRIWRALADVRQGREARCCVLRGPAGVGKSRLAEWIAERADEVGNAIVLRAAHNPRGGPADGLPRMVAMALGCVGLPRLDVQKRVDRFLRARGVDEPYERQALVELIWPAPEEDERRGGDGTFRFGSSSERYELIHRLLGHLAAHQDETGATRPVVLWLDDVQWGPDALGLARYLLARPAGELAALIVLTVRDEGLDGRPASQELLAAVVQHPGAFELPLGPLDPAQRRELVQGLLFLEGEVAAQVEARTAGNPLFAVQLVGDWVQRGILDVGATGFVLKRGALAALPDDIHGLWAERIAQVVGGRPPEARRALELAALMGADVDDAEWRGACSVADIEDPSDVLAELLSRRLARLRPGGWSFAHGMLRESLERAAEEGGRARELHLAAATTLQIRYDVARQPGVAERLGRHLFHAGRTRQALEPLGVGARERRAMSDYASAIRLLDLRDQVLDALQVSADDPAWGEGWVQRAELLIGQGLLDEAMGMGLRVVERAGHLGWAHLLGPAYRMAATAASKRGDWKRSEAWLLQGEERARAVGDEVEMARCMMSIGEVMRLQGRHDDAMHQCRRALARFTAHEDLRGQADAMLAMSMVCRVQGDLERTERYCREAIPLFERIGRRFGVGTATNILGEVLRARGALQEAKAAYHEAEQVLRSLGSPEHQIPMLNLALILVELGEYPEARRRLALVLSTMARSGRRAFEGALHVFLLPCVAAARDWAAWDAHLSAAAGILTDTGFVEPDVAASAEHAARLAGEGGEPARAAAAYGLARAQWTGLGRADRASACGSP